MRMFAEDRFRVDVSRWAFLTEFRNRAVRRLVIQTDDAVYEVEFDRGGARIWLDEHGLSYQLRDTVVVYRDGEVIAGAVSVALASEHNRFIVLDGEQQLLEQPERITGMQIVP